MHAMDVINQLKVVTPGRVFLKRQVGVIIRSIVLLLQVNAKAAISFLIIHLNEVNFIYNNYSSISDTGIFLFWKYKVDGYENYNFDEFGLKIDLS